MPSHYSCILHCTLFKKNPHSYVTEVAAHPSSPHNTYGMPITKKIGTSLFSDLVSIFVNIHCRPTPDCKLFYKELFCFNPCYVWVTKPTGAVVVEAVFSKYQVIVSSCKEAQKLPSLSPAEGSAEEEKLLASPPQHTRQPSSPAPAAVPAGAGWELGLSVSLRSA